MEVIRFLVHYGLHLIAPICIAFVFFRKKWKRVSAVFLLTMLIDLDHLMADEIFDSQRCSINFHPLHSYIAILIYSIGIFWKRTRIVCIGLLMHIFSDWQDCFWLN